jgi:hypothetical protein
MPMTKEQYETAVKLRMAEIAAKWGPLADRIRRTLDRERYEKELRDRFIFVRVRGSEVWDVYDKGAKIGQAEEKVITPTDADPRMATIYNPWLAHDDNVMTVMGATTREEAADFLLRGIGTMPRTDKPPPPKPDKVIGDFFFGT